ncbi:MAG: Asp23/Gls24 family envelope stress response protein [Clostridia bacterium]|nr:Asp23/Gls24 family envelope stress response protein [Clostridia bacterium]
MAENYISCQDDRGSINISEDVIVAMVRAAIGEVEGVAALTQPGPSELAELLGKKPASKGLKVQFVEDIITIDAVISVRYGFNVVSVAQKVQEAVMAAIESMAGMGKPQVNVHVSGVAFDK